MENFDAFCLGLAYLGMICLASCIVTPVENQFSDMIKRLVEMAKPVTNDERQNKYCDYIMLFLSHFGNERCQVVGSTQEGTRLRIRQDDGDYDYLLISEIVIPNEALMYRDDLPCFLNINGQYLKQKFPEVELIDGQYLPAHLLSDISPQAFKHLRAFFQIVSRINSRRNDEVLLVSIDHEIKPGKSLVVYREVDCPELEVENNYKDINQISKYWQETLKKESFEDKDTIICKFAMIVKQYENIDGRGRTSDFLQSFGPIMDAAVDMCYKNDDSEKQRHLNEQNHNGGSSRYSDSGVCDAVKALKRYKNSKLEMNKLDSDLWLAAGPFVDIVHEFCNANMFLKEVKEPNEFSRDKQNDQDDTCTRDSCNDMNKNGLQKIKDTILKYTSKTSKDFIPVFQISGKPKFLVEWSERNRNWPPKNVVEDIYNSDVFVVAKPALINGDRTKDFCLAFNNAEIKLARAMTPVQIKVVLIIKAIKMSSLSDFSEILTTFHWKTVVYWMSESSRVSELEDTTENVMQFLLVVIDHMIDCLTRHRLEHFFIPSNLFAGMDDEIVQQLIAKIKLIRKNPVKSLNQFFLDDNLYGWKEEKIPVDKMESFRQAYNDPREVDKIELVITLLKTFSGEPRETVKEALRSVLIEGLPYFIEEESKGRGKNEVLSPLILGMVSQGNLIDMFLDYIMDPEDHGDEAAKQIAIHFNSLIGKKVLENN